MSNRAIAGLVACVVLGSGRGARASPMTLTKRRVVADIPAGWELQAVTSPPVDRIARVSPASPALDVVVMESALDCAAMHANAQQRQWPKLGARPAWAPADLDPIAGMDYTGDGVATVELCRDVAGTTLVFMVEYLGRLEDADLATVGPVIDAVDRAYATSTPTPSPSPSPSPSPGSTVATLALGVSLTVPARWAYAGPGAHDGKTFDQLVDAEDGVAAFLTRTAGQVCQVEADDGFEVYSGLPRPMVGVRKPGVSTACGDTPGGALTAVFIYDAANTGKADVAARLLIDAIATAINPPSVVSAPAYVAPPASPSAAALEERDDDLARVRGRGRWYYVVAGLLQQQPDAYDATLGGIVEVGGVATTLRYRDGVGLSLVGGGMLGYDLTSRSEYDVHGGVGGALRYGDLFLIPAVIVGANSIRGDATKTSYALPSALYVGAELAGRVTLRHTITCELELGATTRGTRIGAHWSFPRATSAWSKPRGAFTFGLERENLDGMHSTGAVLGVAF
ncbi:MAG: hypothetical protein K8W52_08550 [Deltaproteobacteria bacterium]|nr:hypothetical protein [Deltaproteobacteria bacterium]